MVPEPGLTKVTQITLQNWRRADQTRGLCPEGCACGGCQENSLSENLRTQVLVPDPSPPSALTTGGRGRLCRFTASSCERGQCFPCAGHPATLQ